MLWFIATCFVSAVYNGTRVGMYTSTAPDSLYAWVRIAHVMIAILSITIAGFLSHYVKDEQKWIMKYFYMIFGIFALAVLFGGKSAFIAQDAIDGSIGIFNASVPRLKGDAGIILVSLYGFLLFSILYCLFHVIVWGVTGEKKEVVAMMCGASVLFVTAISDIAMSYKLISFIFIGEYGFFFLMIAMCYATINQIASQWRDRSNRTKTVNSDDLLKDVDTESIKNKLLTLMHEEKVFTDENISLDVMARHLSLPPSKFSRFMNVFMDSDFRNYINKFRVEEAKRLLKAEPDLGIKHICYEVGFQSASTFHDAFKKFTGTSPAKYRKQMSE